jgi:hypothetical protein
MAKAGVYPNKTYYTAPSFPMGRLLKSYYKICVERKSIKNGTPYTAPFFTTGRLLESLYGVIKFVLKTRAIFTTLHFLHNL